MDDVEKVLVLKTITRNAGRFTFHPRKVVPKFYPRKSHLSVNCNGISKFHSMVDVSRTTYNLATKKIMWGNELTTYLYFTNLSEAELTVGLKTKQNEETSV